MATVIDIEPGLSVLRLGNLVRSIFLPIGISNKNDGQGRAWYGTNNDKKRFLNDLVWLSRDDDYDLSPLDDGQYNVVVTRILGKRQRLYDADSVLRGNFKQLMDALVSIGLLADDGATAINFMVALQDSTNRKNGPAIQLDFYAVAR